MAGPRLVEMVNFKVALINSGSVPLAIKQLTVYAVPPGQ